MDLENIDVAKLMGGSATGAVAAVIHVILAGLVISPLMWGSLFYGMGAGFVLGDLVLMVVIGGLLGGIGAFLALQIKSD